MSHSQVSIIDVLLMVGGGGGGQQHIKCCRSDSVNQLLGKLVDQ